MSARTVGAWALAAIVGYLAPAAAQEELALEDADLAELDAAEDAAAERFAIADVAAEVEAIAARLRRMRTTRGRSTLWPRITFTLSVARGAPGRLDRAAGTPPALDLDDVDGLSWSVLATWGAP